jgi:hypothetical protein
VLRGIDLDVMPGDQIAIAPAAGHCRAAPT